MGGQRAGQRNRVCATLDRIYSGGRRPAKLIILGYKPLDIIITLQVILTTTTWLRCAVPSGRELMGDHTGIERLRSLPQRFVTPGGPVTRLSSAPRTSL